MLVGMTNHNWSMFIADAPHSGNDARKSSKLKTSGEMHRFTGHTAAVPAVLFAPDGKSVISGSYDNTLLRWRFGLTPVATVPTNPLP